MEAANSSTQWPGLSLGVCRASQSHQARLGGRRGRAGALPKGHFEHAASPPTRLRRWAARPSGAARRPWRGPRARRPCGRPAARRSPGAPPTRACRGSPSAVLGSQ
eukprot:scaffold74377_cov60-Phaeocystis_antarctica.AAC.8